MQGVTMKFIRPIPLALGLAFAAAGTAVSAQELSISSNQVNITQSVGGFTSNPTISSAGTVGDVSGVPVVASINVPNFGFTLVGGATVANGSYNFNAGVVIDDVNSSRRLEIKVPTLTLTFTGGVMSGTVAAANSTVLGRDASGTVQIDAMIADDGAASISNNTVSFNAASVLAAISGEASPLDDIINTVNAGGSYTYTVTSVPTLK